MGSRARISASSEKHPVLPSDHDQDIMTQSKQQSR